MHFLNLGPMNDQRRHRRQSTFTQFFSYAFGGKIQGAAFDQSKYLLNCDVTYFLFSGASAGKHNSIEI